MVGDTEPNHPRYRIVYAVNHRSKATQPSAGTLRAATEPSLRHDKKKAASKLEEAGK